MKKRKQYSADQKVAVLRRHLVDGEAVSDICDELTLNPNLFYKWQKTFFEHGARAFEKDTRSAANAKREADLRDKLRHKDGVIRELISELVVAKKNIGEL